MGSETRNWLAAISTDGELTAWDPNADSYVQAIAISNDVVYVGGGFTTIGADNRNHIAEIGTNGTLKAWDPNADNTVNTIAVFYSSGVFMGGYFTTVGSEFMSNFAMIDPTTGAVIP
jgi:WD40 repeat protein